MFVWNLSNMVYSFLVTNAQFPNLYTEGELCPMEEMEDYTCHVIVGVGFKLACYSFL